MMDVIRRQNSKEEASQMEQKFSFGLLGTLALIFFILVALATLVYAGYYVWLNNKSTELKQALAEENEKLAAPEALDALAKLTKVRQAQQVLNQRHIVSKSFVALEDLTLPKVQLSSLAADVRNGAFSINAESTDLISIAKQAASFSYDERVKRAVFSSVDKGEGLYAFDLEVEFKPHLFLESQQ